MIISMAYTTSAVVARRKCITRRVWMPSHIRAIENAEKLEAYSRDPRYGGVAFADIRLTEPIVLRSISQDTVENIYEQEGFAFLDSPEKPLLAIAKDWQASRLVYAEVRFEVVTMLLSSAAFLHPDEIAKSRASLIKHLSNPAKDRKRRGQGKIKEAK